MAADRVYELEFRTTVDGTGASQVKQDLREITDATRDANTAAQEVSTGSFNDMADALEKAKGSASDVKDSLDGVGDGLNSNDKIKELTDIIRGLKQASSGQVDRQISGVGRALQSLSSLANLPISQLTLIAGAMSLAAVGVKELYTYLSENRETITLELEALGESSGLTAEKIAELGTVKMDPESIIAGLAAISEAYAEVQRDADAAFQSQQNLQQSEFNLDNARLGRERAREMANAATPEEAAAVGAIFDVRQRAAEQDQKAAEQAARIAKINDDIERVSAERAAKLEAIAELEENVRKSIEKQKEDMQLPTIPADVSGFNQMSAKTAYNIRRRAESNLETVREAEAPALTDLSQQLENLNKDLQTARNELAAIQAGGDVVDMENYDGIQSAAEGLRNLMVQAQEKLAAANAAGSNIDSNAALVTLDRLQRMMETLDAARPALPGAPGDGGPAYQVFEGGDAQAVESAAAGGAETIRAATAEFAGAMTEGAAVVEGEAQSGADKIMTDAETAAAAVTRAAEILNGASGTAMNNVAVSIDGLGAAVSGSFETVARQVEQIARSMEQQLRSIDARVRAAEQTASRADDRSAMVEQQVRNGR